MSCGTAFKVDLYSGCYHNCCYCYAKHLANLYGRWKTDPEVRNNIRLMEQMFENAFERKIEGQVYNLMRERFVLRAGSLTDNFQAVDKYYGAGLRLLELLVKYDYPCVITTKGVTIADQEYVNLLKILAKKELVIVQFSLISMDEQLIHKIEPGAPAPKERLKALKILADNNIPAQVRIAPIIPSLDYEGIIKEIGKSGAKAVILEFLRIPPKKPSEKRGCADIISDAVGFDIEKHYLDNGGRLDRGYIKMPYEKRYEYYHNMKKMIEDEGMICYVCNEVKPDINDFPFECTCCCGIENYNGFKNYNSASSNMIYRMLKERGKLSLEEIKNELKSLDWSLFEKHWRKGVYKDLLKTD